MPKRRETREPVDDVLHALADPSRRRIVERLVRSPATVSELAEPLPMSLPAVVQHLQVLEASGLVVSEKVGRVRTCRLGVSRLEQEAAWIERYRELWAARFDELDKVVEELRQKEKADGNDR